MKRIIAALIAVMMIIPSAFAQTWITVSSWAYNDVSNFKKEGMLPASLDQTGDFTKPVTRLQFAQILYSALTNVSDNSFGRVWLNEKLADTDDKSALELIEMNIFEGELSEEHDENGVNILYFYPDRLLTREEMAVVIERTVKWYLGDDFINGDYKKPDDYDEISEWARESTVNMMGTGLISGVGNNRFAPKENLTIEQAISIVYRLYNHLPTGQTADGAKLDAKTETVVQTYPNGITETKKGNILFIKQGDQVLMEFETDIYSNIYCETVGDKIYAAAQNCYGKTDIYDLAEKNIVAKIPYPVYSVDSEYITAKSSVIGPFKFGLYDWSGNKVTDVNYSLFEIQQLKNNGFKLDTPQYKAPSGMIYFSDWNDNGSLCVIDSNGENKRKLSDINCTSRIFYLEGRLYFIGEENGKYSLYSVKTDGTGEVKITEYTNKMEYVCLTDEYTMFDGVANDREPKGMLENEVRNQDYSLNGKYTQIAADGEWIYYLSDNKEGANNSIWRFKITDNNSVVKEKVTDDVMSVMATTVQFKNNKMYFLDEKKHRENGTKGNYYSDLYCFDGNTVTKISGDMHVYDYGFCNDKLVIFVSENNQDRTAYIAEADGSNPQIMEDIEAAKDRYKQNQKEMQYARENGLEYITTDNFVYDELSDDKFKIYETYTYDGENSSSKKYISDVNGKETLISDDRIGILGRYEDYLMYYEGGAFGVHSAVIRYNMNTGEKQTVINNYYRAMTNEIEGYIFYYDRNLNIWRYDVESNTVEEIAPNSGKDKYGNVVDMFGKGDGMYKLDTDGNYCLVTNKEYAANCLYVENNTGKALMF